MPAGSLRKSGTESKASSGTLCCARATGVASSRASVNRQIFMRNLFAGHPTSATVYSAGKLDHEEPRHRVGGRRRALGLGDAIVDGRTGGRGGQPLRKPDVVAPGWRARDARANGRARWLHASHGRPRRRAELQRSAGVLPRRRHADAVVATPTSRSKSGCRRRTGTASSRRSATAGSPDRSATRRWLTRSRRGYATSSTDTGHARTGASFALGHPEKLIDFGYRAIHEMTVTAKAIVDAFYGNAPRVLLLQRLFDRRTAGAAGSAALPGRLRRHHRRRARHIGTRTLSGVVWVGQSALKDPANVASPPASIR